MAQELELVEADAQFDETEEEALFNHLYSFFARYYADGDFLPLARRARSPRYLVPYNGEDLHFSWRTSGSHYVKSSEELTRYEALADGWRIVFEITEANLELEDVKAEDRYFVLAAEQAVARDKEFYVPFEYRALLEKERRAALRALGVAKAARSRLQEAVLALAIKRLTVPKTLPVESVAFHVTRYARKNREDYFIHRDLGTFLRNELHHYLLEEYLTPESLSSATATSSTLQEGRSLATGG